MLTTLASLLPAILAGTVAGLAAAWLVVKLNKPAPLDTWSKEARIAALPPFTNHMRLDAAALERMLGNLQKYPKGGLVGGSLADSIEHVLVRPTLPAGDARMDEHQQNQADLEDRAAAQTPDYWLTVTGDPLTERAFDTAAECADYKARYDRDGSWTVQPVFKGKMKTLRQLSDDLALFEATLGPDASMADLPKGAVNGTKRAQEGGAA